MLRTGQSPAPSRGGLPPPRRRGLARRRECCYRGPWRLPGPDSHRLAAVSLSLGYVVALLLSVLLGAPSYWTHIPTESSWRAPALAVTVARVGRPGRFLGWLAGIGRGRRSPDHGSA